MFLFSGLYVVIKQDSLHCPVTCFFTLPGVLAEVSITMKQPVFDKLLAVKVFSSTMFRDKSLNL